MCASMSVSVFGDNYIIKIKNIHIKLMIIYQIDLSTICITS